MSTWTSLHQDRIGAMGKVFSIPQIGVTPTPRINDDVEKLRYKFSYSPHPYQVEIHEALAFHRFVVCVAHRRFGKTECAVSCLLADAQIVKKEHGQDAPMFGYVAPYLKQAKAIAWRKLKRFVQDTYGKDWKKNDITKNESELWIDLPNGARIQLFGADNPDAMRGLFFNGIVIDEIADMKEDVWNGVIRPALADRNGWALMIGTPKGMNELFRFYQKGLNEEQWKSLMYSCAHTDLPWLPPSEIRALEDDMTENMFAQEMLCDFSASSDDVLFKIKMLTDCAARQMKISDIKGAARVIGLDVGGAAKGSDRTVMTKRQGLMSWKQQIYKGLDTPAICDMLASEMIQWRADAAIIDNGYGFAVVEQMQRRGFYNVYGVDFGGSPGQPQYANKKTEMFYRTLAWMKVGAKIPNDPELFAELSAHTVSMNERGKLSILKKDEVKKLIRRSPDKCDSLILTNAFDVMPLEVYPFENMENPDSMMNERLLRVTPNTVQDFDPYA